jgi:Ca-activated chloride channel homolog
VFPRLSRRLCFAVAVLLASACLRSPEPVVAGRTVPLVAPPAKPPPPGDPFGFGYSGSGSAENNYLVDGPTGTESGPTTAQNGSSRQPMLQHYGVNPTIETVAEPLSTFGADVDTASYSLARGALERNELPAEAAVRVEEFVNAFDYGYTPPREGVLAVNAEVFPSPARVGYHVLHLGLKAKVVSKAERKPSHLVFTIDVSGSMGAPNRLGLVKRALELLVNELDARDRISIVVYGTTAHMLLPAVRATEKERILEAINALQPEGSTNVQEGLELAYTLAMKAFVPGGINRVLLLSDGVANNGITEAGAIWERVRGRASEGVTLSTVGFGMGSYNDVLMERLADRGDGNYAYVDKLEEAHRVFVENLTGTLQVVAKDVKLQLEFDPAAVERYRLLGFENRRLEARDFANDHVDSGDLGAGHEVTAMYELKLKPGATGPLGTFRMRYKAPGTVASQLFEQRLPRSIVRDAFTQATGPSRLSTVAAGFAEKLRGSYWARTVSWKALVTTLDGLPTGLATRADVVELRRLVQVASKLDARPDRFEKEAPLATMDFDRLPVLER